MHFLLDEASHAARHDAAGGIGGRGYGHRVGVVHRCGDGLVVVADDREPGSRPALWFIDSGDAVRAECCSLRTGLSTTIGIFVGKFRIKLSVVAGAEKSI